MITRSRSIFTLLLCGLCLSVGTAYAQNKKPNVVIWGDDIGQSNISAYTHGLMGYQTPNIDRAIVRYLQEVRPGLGFQGLLVS